MSNTNADWARPLVHWELRAVDPERQRAFYAAMFNWPITDGALLQSPAGIGSPVEGVAGHISRFATPGLVLYFQVRDLSESLEKAAALGGRAESEPFQFPGTPTMAVITDPENNTIVLVQQ